MKKVLWKVLAVVVVGLAAYVSFISFASFSEGSKVGYVTEFKKEGVMFKTWEGKLNEGMFTSGTNKKGNSSTGEWLFTAKNDEVATEIQQLMETGYRIKLYYKEKYKQFSFLGNTKIFVFKAEKVGDPELENNTNTPQPAQPQQTPQAPEPTESK